MIIEHLTASFWVQGLLKAFLNLLSSFFSPSFLFNSSGHYLLTFTEVFVVNLLRKWRIQLSYTTDFFTIKLLELLLL